MSNKFTGERFEPDLDGEIRLEHFHRYAIALDLVRGKSVLDLACGEGYGSFMLAQHATQVLGIDISDETIVDAQKKYCNKVNNLSFQQGSVSKLMLDDSVFDVVTSYETIEHLYEQSEMLAEIRRVLKPDGILIISSPNKPVYSKNGDYQNHFHVKELDFSEFDQLLKKQFKAVEYLGQRLQIGSVIKSLDQNKDYFRAWSDDGENIKSETAQLKEPVYYLAVCAEHKQYLPELSPSVFYPNTLDLLAQYQGYAAWAKSTDAEIEQARQLLQVKDLEIENFQILVAQRDQQIAEMDLEIFKRGEWALGLIEDLRCKQDEINQILRSNSLFITKPLREIRRWISSPLRQKKKYLSNFLLLLKRAYQQLPFSYAARNRHKSIIGKVFPQILCLSNTSNNFIYPVSGKMLPNLSSRALEVDFRLPTSKQPIVSIIIPIYGKVEFTLACLRSIALHPSKIAFEVIVVDDCSPDNSVKILSQIEGLELYSSKENQGFIRSCNLGARISSGQYVHFLNNDTEVTEGWLDNLYQTFSDFPMAGLVGSKLIYPDGSLQEAGGIIWRDGSAWNFGRNQDASVPVFNYAREVDYCSGASIMIPKSIFDDMGGFDELYLPAYYEDSDLAMKIRNSGYSVIYQPLSTVVHFEGVSSGTDLTQGAKAYQVENQKKFYERWKDVLVQHNANGVDPIGEKDRACLRRVLVIDLCTPTPDQDSGSIDAFNIMILLGSMGFQVTFIPSDNFLYIPKYTQSLQARGIEVLYAPYDQSVIGHIKEFGSRYELTFLFRPQVAQLYMEDIRKFCPQAKILFHTVDLHFLRMKREAELSRSLDQAKKAKEMKTVELDLISRADMSTVLGDQEFALLEPMVGKDKVRLLPYARAIRGKGPEFGVRKGLLFVGGFQHAPNIDAVKFFVVEVMPILRTLIPGIKLIVVGSNPTKEIIKLAGSDVEVLGFVENLEPILDSVKISIAPLRYGAGIKGKVGTALSYGLPVVGTSVAAEGMGLTHGENILIADLPSDIANEIHALYINQNQWEVLSKNGVKYAGQRWGIEAASKNLNNVLESLGLEVDRVQKGITLF